MTSVSESWPWPTEAEERESERRKMERTTMKVGKEWFVVFFISQQTSMKTPGFEFLSDLIKNRMWVLWVWEIGRAHV